MRAVVEKSNIIIKVKIVEKHRGLYLAETESSNLLTFTKEELTTQYESWKKNNNEDFSCFLCICWSDSFASRSVCGLYAHIRNNNKSLKRKLAFTPIFNYTKKYV